MFFFGVIDEVCIYDWVLDDDEVVGFFGVFDQIVISDMIVF